MKHKQQDLAEVLFSKIREVAAEDVHLKKTIRLVRTHAQKALRMASENGAVSWREALEKILAVTADDR
jgi:hypothetical protein